MIDLLLFFFAKITVNVFEGMPIITDWREMFVLHWFF